MDATGSPQISDFGLSKMVQNTYGRSNRSGGSVHWMAPELLNQTSELNYTTEVYALAMTLYELWFNKDPFDFMDSADVYDMVIEAAFRPERERHPAIADTVWELFQRCWATDPGGRPSTRDVLTTILSLLDRKYSVLRQSWRLIAFC